MRLSDLWDIAPRAVTPYVLAFANVEADLAPFGIDTPLRMAHFLSQVLHETGGLTVLEENLNYSAERLMVVWPKRFPTLASAQPFAANPRKLANKVYGGRLGNVELGDGWAFHGRGLLQLTGRANYQRIGDLVGLDLVNDPQLVLDPAHSLSVAGCLWLDHGCNGAADTDDVATVTRLVNGGQIGLKSRQQWREKVRTVVQEDRA